MIRSKFKLVAIRTTEWARTFEFEAVCQNDTPENERFHKFTPSGKLTFDVTNPNVNYEVGKYYYFDSTPAQ